MRQDFRIKMDFSQIYQDARRHCWIYIDSTKIFFVNQLADHIQKLFDIKKPFHLLSRFEDMFYFLPFEEDVRVLENNETVLIVPGTGIGDNSQINKNEEPSHNIQNCFVDPNKCMEVENDNVSEKSFTSRKCSKQNSGESTADALSLSSTFYRTAFHDTLMNDSKDSKITEDNATEDNSIITESTKSNKRKRVRKRKQKKSAEVVIESDASVTESSGKKPKIIDSVLISSGKHIRFHGLDNEDANLDDVSEEINIQRVFQNGDGKKEQPVNKDLCTLLSLRQSSTPLTFAHKRIKKEHKPETMSKINTCIETSENSINNSNNHLDSNKSNGHLDSNKSNSYLDLNKSNKNTNLSCSKSMIDSEKTLEDSLLNKSAALDDTVSFKVFRIGEDYTPQLSSVILAKVLSYNSYSSEYTLKILHGIDQLQEPEGKFSLPKNEDNTFNELDDIITLEKSKLLELTTVKAM